MSGTLHVTSGDIAGGRLATSGIEGPIRNLGIWPRTKFCPGAFLRLRALMGSPACIFMSVRARVYGQTNPLNQYRNRKPWGLRKFQTSLKALCKSSLLLSTYRAVSLEADPGEELHAGGSVFGTSQHFVHHGVGQISCLLYEPYEETRP